MRSTFTALAIALFALSVVAATPESQNLVQVVPSAPQILVAAAGATPGANGTFFRSDISIINFANRDQRVQLYWMPQDANAIPPVTITIAARSGVSSEDFVTNYLNVQGLGSLLVSAVDANDQLDTTGALYVTSRIWTPQPGSTGTTSQSFSTIPVRVGVEGTATTGSIFGLRRDTRYRTNVGIVNMHAARTETFQITVFTAGATLPEVYSVTVPPVNLRQIPLNQSTFPITQIFIQKTSAGTGVWSAYGSSTDNVTGDSWSELALLGTTAPTP